MLIRQNIPIHTFDPLHLKAPGKIMLEGSNLASVFPNLLALGGATLLFLFLAGNSVPMGLKCKVVAAPALVFVLS